MCKEFILAECVEREMRLLFFRTYAEAFQEMGRLLMSVVNSDEYERELDYDICEYEAWTNVPGNVNRDWKIFEIGGNNSENC